MQVSALIFLIYPIFGRLKTKAKAIIRVLKNEDRQGSN
jgi:hypothetical protein